MSSEAGFRVEERVLQGGAVDGDVGEVVELEEDGAAGDVDYVVGVIEEEGVAARAEWLVFSSLFLLGWKLLSWFANPGVVLMSCVIAVRFSMSIPLPFWMDDRPGSSEDGVGAAWMRDKWSSVVTQKTT